MFYSGSNKHSQIINQSVDTNLRDRLKDSILEAIGLPLLRLSTNGSQEKVKIAQALSKANDLSASI